MHVISLVCMYNNKQTCIDVNGVGVVLGAVVPTVDVSVTGDVTNGGSLGMVVFTGEIF